MPQPRWLRYSLRTLLVVVLVLSVWLAYHANRAARQGEAVAFVKQLQGNAHYVFEYEAGSFASPRPRESFVSDWLLDLLGVDWFYDVYEISFFSEAEREKPIQVSDEELSQLVSALPNIRVLSLWDASVGDSGLSEVASLKALDRLVPSRFITDDGLRRLRGTTSLTSLDLSYRQITDTGLAYLSEIETLEELDLAGTQVSDAGLKHLENLDQLRVLDLSGTNVSDGGLVHLSELSQLRELSVAGTTVSGAGMGRVPGLERLESIRLDDTQFTDAAITRLSSLSSLKYVYIYGNAKSIGMRIKEFSQSAPGVQIFTFQAR